MVSNIWYLVVGALLGVLGTYYNFGGWQKEEKAGKDFTATTDYPMIRMEERKIRNISSKVSIPQKMYADDPKRAENLALGKLAKGFVNDMLKFATVTVTDRDEERIYMATVDVVERYGQEEGTL